MEAHRRCLAWGWLGGALALALAACMPELNRPEPRADLRVDALVLPFDLDEGDVGSVDRRVDALPDLAQPDRRQTDLDMGRWYQANQKNCPTFCAGLNRSNVASTEQALCMSGEVRPQSGIDAGIQFTYNCWGGCAAMAAPLPSQSYGTSCYLPSQTKDGDDTDRTVGCFCK